MQDASTALSPAISHPFLDGSTKQLFIGGQGFARGLGQDETLARRLGTQ